MIAHALWDFGYFTGLVGPNDAVYPGLALFLLADIVIVVILLVRRHQIEPEERVAGSPTTAPTSP